MEPITEEQGDRLARAVYDTVYQRTLNSWNDPVYAEKTALWAQAEIAYDAATDTEVRIAVCEMLGY